MNTRQLLWRGLWMSALFWPYTHSGGFHDAAVLALTPFWLALGDLWSRWLLKSLTWAIALTAELVLEWSSWPGFRHIIGTFTRSVRVLHALSFAHWDQISAHIATPLLFAIIAIIFSLLGWSSYARQTRTPARIGLNGYKFHTLFYPGVPLTFQSPASLLLYPGKEQFTASNIATYHVTSVIPQFTTQELGSVFFGEYSQAALKEDLQVPRNLSPNVAKLAHQVTRDALGPWQAVSELKAYLDSHYRYSFVVTPSRTNVVNHFLFHDKEGYCDQFSSAFIMMARTLGIPARWVVGYAPGTYNTKKHGYVVRAIDAHSWAQVYIAPYGWVAIDPTPGFYMPGIVKSPPTTPQAQPTAQNPVVSLPKVHYTQIPAASSHHLTNAGQTSSRPHPLSPKHPRQWLWPLLLGGLGILAWVGAWAGQRRRHRFEPASLSAARLWHRVRRWSRWRLRLSSRTLTPREWARYWDSHPNATEAHELAQLLEHGLFSATGWDPREREKAWALWRQLRFVRHFKKATSQVS
ncbi:transglutaminase-like domain-containing protein [Sulfobacillus thermotolerans]|uniref:transglutaminase-like domain-containing protein n=1 Tax=Sulfobacillus thermotolerans TaxID=338644 RepID=UPI003365F3BF